MQIGEEKSKKIWDRIPSDTHVLLTHGPQYNILDDLKEFADDYERSKCRVQRFI
jgi:hypothetical protein